VISAQRGIINIAKQCTIDNWGVAVVQNMMGLKCDATCAHELENRVC